MLRSVTIEINLFTYLLITTDKIKSCNEYFFCHETIFSSYVFKENPLTAKISICKYLSYIHKRLRELIK